MQHTITSSKIMKTRIAVHTAGIRIITTLHNCGSVVTIIIIIIIIAIQFDQ